MSVNPIILKRDIDKWKKLTESIKNKNLDQNTDEAKAFCELTDIFNGTFNKTESERMILNIKDNLNKYASNRELQADLKDFAAICTIWFAKTETEFFAFKAALFPPETKTDEDNGKSGKEDTKQINTILLNRDVEKFRKLSFLLNGEYESLGVDDQSAFEVLSKYYNRHFDQTECKDLIDTIKNNLNKYSSNRNLQANLKEFAALCSIWYTKSEYEFSEFKKVMGGRERKPIIVEDKKQERKEEKKNNQTTVERIDFDNGDSYFGEIFNGQFHGKGKYYWKDGRWYDGDWANGVQHGNGTTYHVSQGRTETGSYKDGSRFGSGKMVWTDGDWYEGGWNENGAHGLGTYYIAQYNRTDTGSYKDGKRFGSGKMVWANGDWYEGGWNENGEHGKGIRYYKNSGRTDTGDYVNGERNGNGIMKWDDGNQYKGTWRETDDGLEGEGIFYGPNGSSQKGRYVKGKWTIDTKSTHTPKTPVYDGNWLQNTGKWIWHNLMWLPWVITALLAIITLITKGFGWKFIGICIGGALASFILMIAIEMLKGLLSWFWSHKWVLAIVIIVILARFIYVSDYIQDLFNGKKVRTEQTVSYQPNYYCNTTELNVRSDPSTNSKILGKIKEGDEIYVYETAVINDFAKIRYKDDIAYVGNKFISKIETGLSEQKSGKSNPINIKRTTSIIQLDDAFNEHEKKLKMSSDDKKMWNIDNVSCVSSKDFTPNDYLVKGNIVFNNYYATIFSVLAIIDDHATFEYLISYDPKGNPIDCVLIGQILNYAGDRTSSIIEGDKIYSKSVWYESEESGVVYIDYQITPQLTFKQLETREEKI